MTTTARLVQQARNRSLPLIEQHRAFTRLVEECQHLVFGLALTLLRDVDEAKDAAQDACATAWIKLDQLRDPGAFMTWVKTIVARECARRRRSSAAQRDDSSSGSVEPDTSRVHHQVLLSRALAALPNAERDVILLYYFLGYSQPEIARMRRLLPGTVAKRLHSARLRLRSRLPPSVRGEFLRVKPSATFAASVQLGIYDEYVGEYCFRERPDLRVLIAREGDTLVSRSAGQSHVLASRGDGSMVTEAFDGEGHFGRNQNGEITHFTYYEFGKRLGVAWKKKAAG